MPIALYRGITVTPEDATAVAERIRAQGLTNEQGRTWQFECIDLRSRLRELFDKPDLTTEDTRPSRWIKTAQGGHRESVGGFPAICACADILGASYYALRHNWNGTDGLTHGLVITFRAEIADLQVDGRDFLYNTVFGNARVPDQRAFACRLFGDALGRYFDRAMAHPDPSYKFAMCDLAVQDEEVIQAHAKNEIVIGGRYGTCFRSAFFVRVLVTSHNIISVDDAQHCDFTPQVTCETFRRLDNETQ